jgi:O-methyltransferase involved in polyketide biosynthesis
VTIGLAGVPETSLWTLYHRVLEARRPDGVLRDPLAVDLLDRIDYPFERNFGWGQLGQAQGQGLRVLTFDREIRRFLSDHPGCTVVALGEGLETQFWRVDDGRVRWLSVDLPEAVELRRSLLPASPRLRELACSALDECWMDEVDVSNGVLVTAQGLFMYLQPPEVHRIIAACARRFAGGSMLFDGVSRWVSARTVRGQNLTRHYQIPQMPWGLDADERRAIRSVHPNVREVRELRLPRGRGLGYGYLLPLANRVPVARSRVSALFPLSIMSLRFGSPPPARTPAGTR